jgi:hypothetical protein
VPPEAEPVAACWELADVPDRAAADALGQLEDLGHGQYRTFRGLLVSRATDTARVPGQDLVILGRRHQDRAEQPVRLGRYRD